MDKTETTLLQAELGKTPDIYPLHSAQEYRETATRMVEQASRTHTTTDAHGNDHEFRSSTAALKQDVAT